MDYLLCFLFPPLAEVETMHGPALEKDKATGWAEFGTFRARFAGGKVVETAIKTEE
jgi:hypothetical protein